jgi:glycosyltransferase involved in cell wall biosynthesis
MRNFQFLKHLGTRHDVWLATYRRPGAEIETTGLETRGIHVQTVPWMPPVNKRLVQFGSSFTARSYTGGIFHQAAMQALIDALQAQVAFDAVLLESSLLSRFRFNPSSALVLDEHNVEYEVLHRTWASERSPVRKAHAFVEYHKFRREEQAAWARAGSCVFTSERERQMASSHAAGASLATVPNGVDLEYMQPACESPAGSELVFVGRIGYRPNTDAVVYFASAILPLIWRDHPQVTLTVVGADVPAEVQALAGPRIAITGPVPDVRPYMRRAAAVVVPLRFGGGTRLKVLEAMGMAKPIVSTTLGCEGLDVQHGRHVLLADDAQAFAHAVDRVLTQPTAAAAVGLQGRRLAERQYSWSKLAADLETVLEAATARHQARPQVPHH